MAQRRARSRSAQYGPTFPIQGTSVKRGSTPTKFFRSDDLLVKASMPESVTKILQDMAAGSEAAQAKLLPLVYAELGRLARHSLGRLQPNQTLQPTALVHEAYLKLFDASKLGWESRGHFFTAAARAMRDILVDQARRKAALNKTTLMFTTRSRHQEPRLDLLLHSLTADAYRAKLFWNPL